MRPVALPILFALVVTATGISARAADTQDQPAAQRSLVDGNNAFALDLYAKLRTQEGNLFFSPYSISIALAMTYAGARGETEKQMAQTLHFGLSQADLHPAFADLIKELTPLDKTAGYELNIANALWGQKGKQFLPAFIALTGKYYGAPLRTLNFADNVAAAKTINDWVEANTNRKVKDLILPHDLNAVTDLVLTNAIYFKGKWELPFKKEATKEEPFTLIDGSEIKTPTMCQGPINYSCANLDDLQVLRKTYAGGRLSMIILLPREPAGLPNVESKLTLAALNDWIAALKEQRTYVAIPKFTIVTPRFILDQVLADLAMKDAFSGQDADFTGIDGGHDLFLNKIIHKAFVDVDEEGTEGAAATGVRWTHGGGPIMFTANHPFIFLIRDDKTGSVLFIGRVMNPKA